MASFVATGPRPDPWEVKQAIAMSNAAYKTADKLSDYFRLVSHDIKNCSLSAESEYGGQIALGEGTNGGVKYTFIAFRGAENVREIMVDLDTAMVVTEGGGVHKGFYERSKSIPLDYLLDVAAKGRLVITGHSLGGACAMLLTAEFIQKYSDRRCLNSVRCITFGCPLVGRTSFCDMMSPFRHMFTNFVVEKDCVPTILSSPKVLSEFGMVGEFLLGNLRDFQPFGMYWKLGPTSAELLSSEGVAQFFSHHEKVSPAKILADYEIYLVNHRMNAYKIALYGSGLIPTDDSMAPIPVPRPMESVHLRPEYCILRGNCLEIYGNSMWLLTSIVFPKTGASFTATGKNEKAAYFLLNDSRDVPFESSEGDSVRLQLYSFFNLETTAATLPVSTADVEEGLMPDALISRMMPLCTLVVLESSGEASAAQEQFWDLYHCCNSIITNIPIEFAFCVIGRSCADHQKALYGKFVKMLLQRLEEVDMDPESLVSVSMINVLAEAIAKLKTLSPAEKDSLNNAGIFSPQASLLSPFSASAAVPGGFKMFSKVSIPGRQMFYASTVPEDAVSYWKMVYEYRIGVSVLLCTDSSKFAGNYAHEGFGFRLGTEGNEEVFFAMKKSERIGGISYKLFELTCNLGEVGYKTNFYMFGVDEWNQKTFDAITVLLGCAPFAECLATTGWLHVMGKEKEDIGAFACSNMACALKRNFDELKAKHLEQLRSQIGNFSISNSQSSFWATRCQVFNSRREAVVNEVRTVYKNWIADELKPHKRLRRYLDCLKRDMHRTHRRVGASYFCGQSISMIVRCKDTGVEEPFFNFIPATRSTTAGLTKAELIEAANEISDASQFLSLLLEGAVQRVSVHLDEPGSMVNIVANVLLFPVRTLMNSMYGIGQLGLFMMNSFDPQYLMTARNNFVDSWHEIAYSQRLLVSYDEILKAICEKAGLRNHPRSSANILEMEEAIAQSVASCHGIVENSVSELCRRPKDYLMATRYESYVEEHRNVPVLMFFLKLAYCSWKIRNTRKNFTVVTIGGKNNGGKTTLIDELFPGKLAAEDKPGGTADRVTVFPRAFSQESDPFTLYVDLPGITDEDTFNVARMMALCGNVTVFVMESMTSKSDNNAVNINSIKNFLMNKKGHGLICINQFDRNLDAPEPEDSVSGNDSEPEYYSSDSESESGRSESAGRVAHIPIRRPYELDSDDDRSDDGVEESKAGAAPAAQAPLPPELESDDDRSPAQVGTSKSASIDRNIELPAPPPPSQFWEPIAAGRAAAREEEYEQRLSQIVRDEAAAWRDSSLLKVSTWLTKSALLECEKGHQRRVTVESGHEAVHAKGCGCGCAEAVVFSGTDANGWHTSIWLTCFDRNSRKVNRNSRFVDRHVFSAADVQAWVLETKAKKKTAGFGGLK